MDIDLEDEYDDAEYYQEYNEWYDNLYYQEFNEWYDNLFEK